MIKPKQSVLKMVPYHPPIEGRGSFIRLDFNENQYGPSPKLKGLKLDTALISMYPEYSLLKSKLSSSFRVGKDEVLPTNGADEGIKTVIDTFVEKGDEVIILTPSFPLFRIYSLIAGAGIKEIPYNSDFSFPLEKLLERISKKTRMVIIANPNNPTGTTIGGKGILRILDKAGNSIILLDEAYSDFSGVTCVGLIRKYTNLIIARSFSKVFGLAGLRLGLLISCRQNIGYLGKVRSPYSVNSVAVNAALKALDDKGYAKRYVHEIRKNRREFACFLRKRGVDVFEGHANFILAKIPNPGRLYLFLKKRGILIREVPLNGYIRITIGTKSQMRRLMQLIGDYLE